MNWTTLYITGRDDFSDEVRRKLSSSSIDFMPGYLDNSSTGGSYDLFWIDEKVSLRKVKETIGAKLIWKYRLQFFTNLEEFLQSVREASSKVLNEDRNQLTAMRRQA